MTTKNPYPTTIKTMLRAAIMNRLPGCAPFLIAALLCCLAISAHAQFPGFGGLGQQGGTQNRRTGSTSGQYPDNQVGDAYFSIDPNTRQLIVVADPDTQRWVSNVVADLNRPQPQVLI